ncbi:MAG: hypothetical protein H6823_13480 [Planctomycetaceae bacterium]|nr:hypothetical protein [Planctomycetaceae bacterium]
MSMRGKGPLFDEPDCDAARQWFRDKPKQMSDKVMSVEEAVRRFVADGDYLASGGFGGSADYGDRTNRDSPAHAASRWRQVRDGSVRSVRPSNSSHIVSGWIEDATR